MTKHTSKKLTRRDAIKILGAAAGASVLANLPSKWSTPELASGVLPAHAQTSLLSITGCTLIVASGINPPDDDTWSSTATVGVPLVVLKYTLTFFNISFSSQFPGPQVPNPVNGTATTDGAGVATIDNTTLGLETLVVDSPGDGSGNYSFTVLWEFNDSSVGSGNCSQMASWSSL